MKVYEIETPALLIDYDIMQKNSSIMMDAINNSKAKLRPHFKSHKCTEITKFQLDNGAKGVTVAKLSEAEVILNEVSCDLLIANQIVEESKLTKLAKLAKNHQITICVDNKQNVLDLERAMSLENANLSVLIEFEIGMQRCGVITNEEFYSLYLTISQCPHLKFRGIQAYAGHVSHEVDLNKRLTTIDENNKKLFKLIDYLQSKNVFVEVVSGASTGTAHNKMNQGIYNEIQAGSYLFLDDCYNKMGLEFSNALFVLTSVVSSKENLVVVDAGVKTVGVDQGLPSVVSLDCDHIVASEEHFQIHKPSKNFNIGDKLKLIPGHCCSTMNLHDKVYLISGDEVVKTLSINGRGFGK